MNLALILNEAKVANEVCYELEKAIEAVSQKTNGQLPKYSLSASDKNNTARNIRDAINFLSSERKEQVEFLLSNFFDFLSKKLNEESEARKEKAKENILKLM